MLLYNKLRRIQTIQNKMKNSNLKIALIAGEASGDLLGSHLIRALKETEQNITFFGIGGPLMINEGFTSFFKQSELSVIGYFEILANLPKILNIRRKITQLILVQEPDVVIGIDLPDFNFYVEKRMHKRKIPTIHYVSPSIWAWKEKRATKMVKFLDDILCLFPMEPKIYESLGGKATFVGHPLASEIPLDLNLSNARANLNIPNTKTLITIMPGSRKSELQYMTALFLQTAERLFTENGDIEFKIPTVDEENKKYILSVIEKLNLAYLPIEFIDNTVKHLCIAASNLTLVASGTATLEVALCKSPMIISYKISPITYHLVKPFVKIPYVGLPNIILGEALVPELIQQNATVELLFQTAQNWLNNNELQANYLNKITKLHTLLKQNTNQLAADAVLRLIPN